MDITRCYRITSNKSPRSKKTVTNKYKLFQTNQLSTKKCRLQTFYLNTDWKGYQKIIQSIKVHLTPKYFFRLNNSLHLFETHCAFLPLFSPNLDFLQAVEVKKSGHHLFHDRASKGYGSIPGLTSQMDLHRSKSL